MARRSLGSKTMEWASLRSYRKLFSNLSPGPWAVKWKVRASGWPWCAKSWKNTGVRFGPKGVRVGAVFFTFAFPAKPKLYGNQTFTNTPGGGQRDRCHAY